MKRFFISLVLLALSCCSIPSFADSRVQTQNAVTVRGFQLYSTNHDYQGRIKFSAKPVTKSVTLQKSVDQTLTTGASAYITWDVTDLDTDSVHNNVTNNTRITIPSGVTKVRVVSCLNYASNVTGSRGITLYKNGSAVSNPTVSLTVNAVSGSSTVVCLPAYIISTSPGDYFEVVGYQTSGGNLNVIGGTSGSIISVELTN